MSKSIFKIGDKVKLTPSRFKDFNRSQGVIDPNRIYTISGMDYPIRPGYNIFLTEIKDQAHGENHLIRASKPTIILEE